MKGILLVFVSLLISGSALPNRTQESELPESFTIAIDRISKRADYVHGDMIDLYRNKDWLSIGFILGGYGEQKLALNYLEMVKGGRSKMYQAMCLWQLGDNKEAAKRLESAISLGYKTKAVEKLRACMKSDNIELFYQMRMPTTYRHGCVVEQEKKPEYFNIEVNRHIYKWMWFTPPRRGIFLQRKSTSFSWCVRLISKRVI